MLHRYRRGLVVAATTISLLIPSVFPALAAPPTEAPVQAVATKAAARDQVTLEEAIRIAKDVYPDVSRFDEFNSDYNEYEGRGIWELRWNKEGEPGGSCNINVSAATGEILYLSIWQGSSPGIYKGMPTYTKAQAQDIAACAAKKLLPEKFGQCILVPSSPFEGPITFSLKERTYPVVYNFRFTRTVQGIPVTGNEIRVGVNAENGQMQHFDVQWEDNLQVPDATGHIGTEQAAQIFTKQGLELAYSYFGPRDKDTGVRPKLIYQVKNDSFFLDAMTGKVEDPREGRYYFDLCGAGGMGGNESMKQAPQEEPPLSDAEQSAVDKLVGLLTADQAQAKAESVYALPKGMQLTSKNLQQNWDVPGNKLWRFSYTDKEKKHNKEIKINAATGELLGFSTYEDFDSEDYVKKPEIKVSEDQARKIAEAFIKKQQPARAEQVEFRCCDKQCGPWSKFGDESPRTYSLGYSRLVNGVVYPANGFTVSVNSTTGEVTDYNMAWWDTSFPAPTGLIDPAKAAALYLEKHPLTLEYARAYNRFSDGSDQSKFVLLYHLTNQPMGTLDAKTGQEIDGQGKPIVSRKTSFTDVAGHPAARDIQLLADQGIVSSEDQLFRPNDRITGSELLAWLVSAADRNDYPRPIQKADHQQVLDQAVALGIIGSKDGFNSTGLVTKVQAARWLVRSQGFGALARHGEAFKLSVQDASAIAQADRGYVASALVMGYLAPENGNRFGPQNNLTRGQAASMLIRALLEG